MVAKHCDFACAFSERLKNSLKIAHQIRSINNRFIPLNGLST